MDEARKPAAVSAEALMRILEVTRKLAAPYELSEMLAQVIDAGRSVLDADRGTVFLYDAKTDELFSSVGTGIAEIRFSADRGIVGECARTRRLINVPDCYADPRFNPEIDRKTGYRTRCLLTVPLIGHDDSLVGVLQLLNKRDGVFTPEDGTIAEALAAQCAVALQRVRMLSELMVKEKMERELAVARDIQIAVLPKSMPRLSGYDLDGWSRPADQTGGDVFDAVVLDDHRIMLLIGDATGHGIGPALSVTQVRAMLRIAMRLGADLVSSFRHINEQLAEDLASNRFVTAFLGILDSATHKVVYHSGGQGPLLHVRVSGGHEWRGATTLPMGFIGRKPLKAPETYALEPGDTLALMTDGIYEYANEAGEMFGQERVVEILRAHAGEPAVHVRERLVKAVEEFGGAAPQEDDMTILIVRRLPA